MKAFQNICHCQSFLLRVKTELSLDLWANFNTKNDIRRYKINPYQSFSIIITYTVSFTFNKTIDTKIQPAMGQELEPPFVWLDKNTVLFEILEIDWINARMQKCPEENNSFHFASIKNVKFLQLWFLSKNGLQAWVTHLKNVFTSMFTLFFRKIILFLTDNLALDQVIPLIIQ